MSEPDTVTYWVHSDDPELQAIEVLIHVFDGVDRATQARIFQYVLDRYGWELV